MTQQEKIQKEQKEFGNMLKTVELLAVCEKLSYAEAFDKLHSINRYRKN